ncbi:MAG: methyltransferase domain-containing protein [bacterium]|nr:methyltransferase domain-containing protein [bacterium]MCP5065153.1 methyltransferase domain-containing protein [bacterium]
MRPPDPNDVKAIVQRQFGAAAAHYGASHVHAGGPDLDALVERACRRRARTVLDVGCGAGHTALALATRGLHVIGLDLTEAMLDEGRGLAKERGLDVTFQRGDVEALPFPDASFELVTSRYSAHHYPHPERALAEIARVLMPGGALLLVDIVSTPDPAADSFLQTIELVRDPSHVRDHTTHEWARMLEAAGLHARDPSFSRCEIDFEAWIRRMATPEREAAVLRKLLDGAPATAREFLQVGTPGAHDFILTTALIEAEL